MSDQTDFRGKITRDKEIHFMGTEGTIPQENVTVLNIIQLKTELQNI